MESRILDKVAVFKGSHLEGINVKVIKPKTHYDYIDGKDRIANHKVPARTIKLADGTKFKTTPPIFDRATIYRYMKNYEVKGKRHCLFFISRDSDIEKAEKILDSHAKKGIDDSYLRSKARWAYV